MMTHFGRPRASRGLLPLILGALSIGKGIYGAIQANQQKQRNKGYINDAYRSGVQRMETRQGDVRQSTSESLNARGLLGGGVSPIHKLMAGGSTVDATDLGSQRMATNESEFGLERHDLDAQHERDLNENKAAAVNAQIGSIAGGIQGAISAYSTGQDMKAMNTPAASVTNTPIHSQLLSGSAFDNVHPVDPLGDPSSSWHIPRTINGAGMTNSDFNTGLS